MITISLRFPSGRFHATPWGKHVNEGVPEWPPSPWRLLRSLIAVWKTRFDTAFPVADVEPVFRALAKPPRFVLPPAAVGHTRHYMRWYKKGPALVFDTFVALDRDAEVVALWPDGELSGQQRNVLQRLLDHLGFFGRAESWCDARLLDETCGASTRVNCLPLETAPADTGQEKLELVRVLCADPQTAFSSEHVQGYDPNWHLCVETSLLHAEGWSDAPGSKWVPYFRPVNCFEVKVWPRRASVEPPRIQVARFALDSAVLPLVQETLPMGELARRVLMGIYGRLTEQREGARGRSPVFSGKDDSGHPLQGHGHAYYLPSDEDGDGRLDHLTVVAEAGFGPVELKALDRLRAIMRNEELPPLNVLLLGLGRLDEFQPFPLRPSSVWVSATPFVAPRHLKKRGTKRDPEELWDCPTAFLTAVLRKELDRLIERRPDLAAVPLDSIKVEALTDEHGVFRIGPHRLRPIQFKRFRQKRDDDGGRRPAGVFRITFSQPVRGPICLGHSSHFGLGQFRPVGE